MFQCHLCNVTIESYMDIFRARDNNYCSRYCRLKSFYSEIDYNIDEKNHIYKNNDIITPIKSHNSCHNFEFISNAHSYNVTNDSKKSSCNNYLTTTFSQLLYTVNSLLNIYYYN